MTSGQRFGMPGTSRRGVQEGSGRSAPRMSAPDQAPHRAAAQLSRGLPRV